MGHSRLGGSKAKFSQVIGEHAVLLFRLVPVKRTQPRLHVHHRDLELAAGQGPGQGGVGVAVHQQRIGPFIQQRRSIASSIRPVLAPWLPPPMPK